MKKNWKLILCYVVIFCYIVLGNAMTFNFGNRLPFKISELLSMFLIFFLLIDKKEKLKISTFNFKLLIWLLIGFISLIINTIKFGYSISSSLYGALYGLRIIHLMLLCYLIKDYFKENKIDVKKIFNFIINCYIIVCIIGFIQLIFYPKAYDFYNIFYNIGVYFPNADPHVGRLISTYFDPNYLAACLLIPTAICLIYWNKYNEKKYFIKFLILSITIMLTVSRSGLLGYLIVIFLFTINSFKIEQKKLKIDKKILKLVLCIGIVLVMLFLSGKSRVINRVVNSSSDKSTYYRFDNWQYSLDIIKDNSLIGVGYNLIGTYSDVNLDVIRGESVKYGSDSSLLLIAMTTGMIGFTYFIIMIIKYIIENIKLKKKNSIYSIAILILIPALICCNFNNVLFYTLWMFPMLLIFNILEGEKYEDRDRC
ncbi:MAG: O-antigen ligase family protein [Bacilli bacterium]|nr:O-antigen ligase family protein [Bacilli bacterium]